MEILNDKQRETTERVVVNLANLSAGIFIFGSFISPQGFSWKMFTSGILLFFFLFGVAVWINRSYTDNQEREDE